MTPAAPALSRQLAVISNVVNSLIECRVTAITQIKREPLPEEGRAASASGSDRNQREGRNGGGGRREQGGAGNGVVSRYPFDIGFTADQGKFRVALNSIVNSSDFLVIRSVAIQNTQTKSPSHSDIQPIPMPLKEPRQRPRPAEKPRPQAAWAAAKATTKWFLAVNK